MERIQRYEGEESVKVEVIQELEREFDTTKKQLKQLELSAEARRRREIQTLRRFGVMDNALMRYSLPDIEISHIWTRPSLAEETAVTDDEELEENEDEDSEQNRKKKAWKPLNWLSVSPLFRQRSRSDAHNRKYRAMSAGVVAASTSTTVQNLRRLYTGRSEFYDHDDEPIVQQAKSKSTRASHNDLVPAKPTVPIDPKTLEEINLFENLIKNYFRKKQHKRQ